jgi:hypothetical protein
LPSLGNGLVGTAASLALPSLGKGLVGTAASFALPSLGKGLQGTAIAALADIARTAPKATADNFTTIERIEKLLAKQNLCLQMEVNSKGARNLQQKYRN